MALTVENQMLLHSASGSGLVTNFFSQHGPVSPEDFNLGTLVFNNPTEGLLSSQDHNLCFVNVEPTLLDHFKYPPTIGSQQSMLRAEVPLHGNSSYMNEHLEKYKELNLPEQAKDMYSTYLPPNDLWFLSPVETQHQNLSVPTSSIFSPEGTDNQTAGIIPGSFSGVARTFMPPLTESSCGSDQTGASDYDEIEEVREAVESILENDQDRTIFQSSNPEDNFLVLQRMAEETGCAHGNNASSVVNCQLEGNTPVLYMNPSGTPQLELVYLVPEYHNQQNSLQSDVDNSAKTVLDQYLPVPGDDFLNTQVFGNGGLQPEASTATYPVQSDLSSTEKMTSAGSSLNQRQPQCERPCDGFANGDFCNNCNCHNCYNNQLHQTETLRAVQAEIQCPPNCKCIGCKDSEEGAEEKEELSVLNHMELGKKEQKSPASRSTFTPASPLKKIRKPAACMSEEKLKAICVCLLLQAEEAEYRGYSSRQAEQMIMEEFGICLTQLRRALLRHRRKNLTC